MSQAPVGRIDTICLDVSDVHRSNRFWTELLGFPPGEPRRGWVKIGDIAPGVRLILQEVPERKLSKNRMHFDIAFDDLEEAVKQIVSLGGRKLEERDDGLGPFCVMADPDGNEFCIGAGEPI
jgi:catechol 2,3-dioxygenase-like lactoylglutathione lyase family enzyme